MVHTTCAALHCLSSSYTDTDLKFHQFPHDAERRKIWITACKRSDMIDKDWDFFKHKHVCSLHFEKCMYGKKDRLKKSAIPSLHLSEKPLQHESSTQTVESMQYVNQRSENDVPISYVTPNVENNSTSTYTQNEGSLPYEINQVNIKEEIITRTKIEKSESFENDVETKTENDDDDENSDSVSRVPILFEEDVEMKTEIVKSEILPFVQSTQSLHSDDRKIIKDGGTLSTQARNPVQEIDHGLTASKVNRTSTNPINTTMMPILKRKMDGSIQTDKVIVLSQNADGTEGSINPDENSDSVSRVPILFEEDVEMKTEIVKSEIIPFVQYTQSVQSDDSEIIKDGGTLSTQARNPVQEIDHGLTASKVNRTSTNPINTMKRKMDGSIQTDKVIVLSQNADGTEGSINPDENSDSVSRVPILFEEDVEMKTEIVKSEIIPFVQSTQSLQSDDSEIIKDGGTLSTQTRNPVQEIDHGLTASKVNRTSTNPINTTMMPILKRKMDGSIQADKVIVLSQNADGTEGSINPDENSDSVSRVPILFEEDVEMKTEIVKREIIPFVQSTQSLQSDDSEIIKDGGTLSTQARNTVQEIDHGLTAPNVNRTSTNPINTAMMPILKRKMDGSIQIDKVIVLSQNAVGSEGLINPEERRCKRNDYVVITRPQIDRASGKFLSTKLSEANSSDGSVKVGAAESVEGTVAERGGVATPNVVEAGTLSEKPLQHDSSTQTVESLQYVSKQSENAVSIKYVMSNVEKSSTTTYTQTEDSLKYDINHVNIKEEIKTENDDDENSDSEAFEENVEMKIEIVEHTIPLEQSTQSLQSDDLEIMKDCGTLSTQARNLEQEIDQGLTATNVNITSTNRINTAMTPILKRKMDGSIQTDRVIVLSRNADGSERSINPEECLCDRNDYIDMTRQQFYRACSNFLSANFAITVQRQLHIDAVMKQGGHELICEAGSSGSVKAGAAECVELNAAGCGGVVLPDDVIAGTETADSAEADLYAVDCVEPSAAASAADSAQRTAPAPRQSLPPPQMEVEVEAPPPSPPPLPEAFSVPSPAAHVDYDIVHRWAWCRLHNVELALSPALECPRPRQNLHDDDIFEQLSSPSPPQMEVEVEGVAPRPEAPPPSPPLLSGAFSVPSPALYVDYDIVHRWASCQLHIEEPAPSPAIEPPRPRQNLHDENIFEQLHYGSEADSEESDDEEFSLSIFPRVQRSVLDTPMDGDDDAELVPALGPAAAAVPAEYATARTSNSSILDVPLAATDQPWSLYDFDWKPFPNAPIPPESRREMFSHIDVGPTTPCVDPYDIFVAIWDRQFMEYIASETNRYAQQVAAGMLATNNLHPNSRLSKWRETTADEMYVYFGLLIAMGVVVKSRVEEYWNATPDVFYTPGFSAHMSSSRFAILSKCLHFANIQDMCALELDGSEAKLFKVQPVLSHLNNEFSSMYRLRQNIALDESLLQWKSWLDISQIPNKAATVGIKTYEICESQTGYLWRFEVNDHKKSQRSPTQQFEDPLNSSTLAIVLRLTHGLEGKGHTLWMDSFYNSPCIARRLKALGFDCVGTLRTDRKFVPQALHSLTKENMRPGQISGLTSRDVDVMVWRDNNRVSMISTYHGNAVAQIRDATKPILIHDYNIIMGGVDKKDQMLAMYPIERKQTKVWYKKLFRRLLNVSILNSYIIHRQSFASSPSSPLTHRNFRIALVKSLLSKHSSSTLQPATSQILHQNKHFDVTHRLAEYPFGNHNKNKRQRRRRKCVNCSKLVHTFCVGCNKTICIDSCFVALHT